MHIFYLISTSSWPSVLNVVPTFWFYFLNIAVIVRVDAPESKGQCGGLSQKLGAPIIGLNKRLGQS